MKTSIKHGTSEVILNYYSKQKHVKKSNKEGVGIKNHIVRHTTGVYLAHNPIWAESNAKEK